MLMPKYHEAKLDGLKQMKMRKFTIMGGQKCRPFTLQKNLCVQTAPNHGNNQSAP